MDNPHPELERRREYARRTKSDKHAWLANQRHKYGVEQLTCPPCSPSEWIVLHDRHYAAKRVVKALEGGKYEDIIYLLEKGGAMRCWHSDVERMNAFIRMITANPNVLIRYDIEQDELTIVTTSTEDASGCAIVRNVVKARDLGWSITQKCEKWWLENFGKGATVPPQCDCLSNPNK